MGLIAFMVGCGIAGKIIHKVVHGSPPHEGPTGDQIYDQAMKDYWAGYNYEDNPYPYGSWMYNSWEDGFREAFTDDHGAAAYEAYTSGNSSPTD